MPQINVYALMLIVSDGNHKTSEEFLTVISRIYIFWFFDSGFAAKI